MARVELTKHLHRFAGAEDGEAEGATVGEVLEAYFAAQPHVRSYVVDEHGAIRKHVVVFLDGRQLQDRRNLSQPVGPDDTIHIMQALSGG